MRYGLIVLWTLFCAVTSAAAQVSIGIGRPSVSIGINLPFYPDAAPPPRCAGRVRCPGTTARDP